MLRAVIIALAVLAGGAAAWLSTGVSGFAPASAETSDAAAPVPMQDVLVAAADIAPGAIVEPGTMRWQPWPQNAVGGNYITRSSRPDAAEALSGTMAQSGILAGEPVHEGKLVTGEDAGVLSIMLPSGSRAVAVRISAENTAGGFILPNDRVDVLHTTTRQGADGRTAANSRAILRNVRVLAIDQTTDNTNGSILGQTATLELGPEEAEIITAAEADGTISLALRPLADSNERVVEELVEVSAAKSVRVFRAGQEETVELN